MIKNNFKIMFDYNFTRSMEVTSQVQLDDEKEIAEVSEIESFLKDLSPDTIEHKLGVRINQMLRKYRDRKLRIERRAKEVKYFIINLLE